MLFKVDITNTNASALPFCPLIRRKTHLAKATCPLNNRCLRPRHDHDLDGPQILFDVQSQRFPVVSETRRVQRNEGNLLERTDALDTTRCTPKRVVGCSLLRQLDYRHGGRSIFHQTIPLGGILVKTPNRNTGTSHLGSTRSTHEWLFRSRRSAIRSRPDDRQNAGPDGLRQMGPSIDNGLQIGGDLHGFRFDCYRICSRRVTKRAFSQRFSGYVCGLQNRHSWVRLPPAPLPFPPFFFLATFRRLRFDFRQVP